MRGTYIEVDGFTLDPGLLYDPQTHMWVEPRDGGIVRVGFDPLGRETSGDIVSLSFVPVGTVVDRGGSFGDVEAAKLVGPLLSPVAGTVRAHSADALADPGMVNHDPLGAWLVELEPDPGTPPADGLLTGDALPEWFSAEVARFRAKGMIAE
ncbi:glycine cleavage system protein H [Paraconexibacter sp.]|uniref:glycine cleavage system protein H n=1 Tax=Paraconexibacter sp. TaxID=2949640 RepID=UPI003561E67D